MVLVSTLVSPGQGCAMITIPQMFSREMWAASCQSPRGLSFSGVIVFYIALPRWPKKGVTCQRSSMITLVVQIMKPRMEIEFFWLHAFDIEAGSQKLKTFLENVFSNSHKISGGQIILFPNGLEQVSNQIPLSKSFSFTSPSKITIIVITIITVTIIEWAPSLYNALR